MDELINVVRFCSIFENCNFLKTQMALCLCNLGDDIWEWVKKTQALPDLFSEVPGPRIKIL